MKNNQELPEVNDELPAVNDESAAGDEESPELDDGEVDEEPTSPDGFTEGAACFSFSFASFSSSSFFCLFVTDNDRWGDRKRQLTKRHLAVVQTKKQKAEELLRNSRQGSSSFFHHLQGANIIVCTLVIE